MKNHIKLMMLTGAIALTPLLGSCDTFLTPGANVLYHLDLESNDDVKLETKEENVAAGKIVKIKVTMLNEEAKLVGLESSDGTTIEQDKNDPSSYSFKMPEASILVKAVIEKEEETRLEIEGTYFAPNGICEKDSKNNILKIDESLKYTFTKNDDYEKTFYGELKKVDDHYISFDSSIYLTPILEENSVKALLFSFIDLATLETSNMVLSKDSYVTILNTVVFEDGYISRFKVNNLKETNFAFFKANYVSLIDVANFETTFKEDITYEVSFKENKIYLRFDGEKLFRASKERGVYSYNNNETTIIIELDGFNNYIYDKANNEPQLGKYNYDEYNSYLHLDNDKHFELDLTSKVLNEYKPEAMKLTGLIYQFKTTLVNDVSYDVSLKFKENTLIDLLIHDVRAVGYKLNGTELSIKLTNNNEVHFNVNFDTYKLTYLSGYFINEGDATSLEVLPKYLKADLDNKGEIMHFQDFGQYFVLTEDGRESYTSYKFILNNNKLYIKSAFDPYTEYFDFDLAAKTLTEVKLSIPE